MRTVQNYTCAGSRSCRRSQERRGATVVLVAVCLVAIVGVVALAIDGGVLLDKRRSVQAAADAAALAAATDLWDNFATNDGLDPNGTGKACALLTATANGFNNDGVASAVTVNIPPASGIASGKADYAEIIIQANQKRWFSAIFGSGTVPVQARAVACGNPSNVGVYILDPTDDDCFAVDGNLNVSNGGVVNVNSSASGAGQIAGTGNLTCGGINVVGNVNNAGTITYTSGGSLKAGAAAVADPYASIPEPSPSGTNYGNKTYNSDATISPGMYSSITIGPNATVTMQPGIYYLGTEKSPGSGLNFPAPPKGQTTAGTLQGSGVMIYNYSGDSISPQPSGSLNLSAPTSGPYRGIVLYQPRTSNQQIHIESTANITLSGALYAQNGFFDLRPDGSTTTFSIGTYVGYKIEACEGNDQKSKSNGNVVVIPGAGVPTLRPKLVE